MWKNIGQFSFEETDRNTHTQCGNERLVIHSHKLPNSLMDFTAGYGIAHTYTPLLRVACWMEGSQKACKAAVQHHKAVCAFKFHDPLFTAGAGWLAGSARARCLE